MSYITQTTNDIKSTIEQTQTFCSDSIRFLNKCNKPDKKEFKKIATSCAIGFAIMGVVGYLIKLSKQQRVGITLCPLKFLYKQ